MDKRISYLILLIFLLAPLGALAQLRSYGPDIEFTGIMDKIETAIWVVFGLIVVICFIMAAVLFLTAQGQADKLTAAKSAFIWGVVGVIVGIIAFSIVELVSNLLTSSSTT